METQRRRCDFCNNGIDRRSFAKHLRSKKHLEFRKKDGMIVLDWLFQKSIEIKIQEKKLKPQTFKTDSRR